MRTIGICECGHTERAHVVEVTDVVEDHQYTKTTCAPSCTCFGYEEVDVVTMPEVEE